MRGDSLKVHSPVIDLKTFWLKHKPIKMSLRGGNGKFKTL